MFFKKSFQQGETSSVHWINCINQFQSIRLNVYAFYIDGILIDTGAESLKQFFCPFFDELPIDRAIITHYHEDHTGCAAYLQQKGIPIFMSDTLRETCTKRANYPLYRKLFWGKRKPFHAQVIGETFESRTSTWQVIETPGHAADHLAFLNETTGQLFTGDLYVNPRTKVILREESIPQIIESLEKILSLDFDELFCQHVGLVPNGRQALKNKLNYLHELQGRVMDLKKQGYSEREIQQQVFLKKYPIMRVSGGEWDSLHIVTSILKKV